MTGEPLPVKIFMGPTYYQRLQKFATDEKYAIGGSGVTCAMTRQPLAGKAHDGGLRIGEMEKDVFCAHGSVNALMEKMKDHADRFSLFVCRKCGRFATAVRYNATGELERYKCKKCGDMADIAEIKSGYANKMLLQEVQSCNVGMRMQLRPHQYSQIEDVD